MTSPPPSTSVPPAPAAPSTIPRIDLDAFAAWLLRHEVPAEFIPRYRSGAARILTLAGDGPLRPKHVDEAVRAAEAKGLSARRQANVQRIGQALLDFQASLHDPRPAAPAPTEAGPAVPGPTNEAAERANGVPASNASATPLRGRFERTGPVPEGRLAFHAIRVVRPYLEHRYLRVYGGAGCIYIIDGGKVPAAQVIGAALPFASAIGIAGVLAASHRGGRFLVEIGVALIAAALSLVLSLIARAWAARVLHDRGGSLDHDAQPPASKARAGAPHLRLAEPEIVAARVDLDGCTLDLDGDTRLRLECLDRRADLVALVATLDAAVPEKLELHVRWDVQEARYVAFDPESAPAPAVEPRAPETGPASLAPAQPSAPKKKAPRGQ